ncbi:hypothetical protein [Tomitella gaofuii]|uniref:hypothetical protein n=1 Tax=Tomitella gaofuii TaxID=2760083 RepID=UPI0015FAE137|nr:hypothetical protein [Tomitella gaofuii]
MRFGKKPGDPSADAVQQSDAAESSDTTKTDSAQTDSAQTDSAQTDSAQTDSAKSDAAKSVDDEQKSGDAQETGEAETAAVAADDGAQPERSKGGAPKRTRRTRLAMITAAAGAVVFTLAAALSGWQWAEHNGPYPADASTAFVDQSATAQAAQAARDIVQGVFSYSYQDLDAYQDSLAKFLNKDMLASYQKTADQNVQIITQAKTTIKATVGEGNVGIEKLDGDEATAVVIMERSGTNGDSQQISDAAPLRVQMEKINGQWKAKDMRLL